MDSLIDQLNDVLATKDLSRRAEILRQVTDLFMLGSGKFTDEQIDLFDDVMGKLVAGIEIAARATFGSRLSMAPDAPRKVIRALAFDDAVEVAAPVLTHSVRLDDATLVENAETKSQGHLLAISGRSTLVETVTDVLVTRGNHPVLARTAANRGAKFSSSGMSTLVKRAQDHSDLVLCIWSRPDIPRHDLVRLFAQASEIVRRKLEAADPRRAALIRSAVASASEEIQAIARTGSHEHATAFEQVQSLHARGQLDEAKLMDFAHRGDFDRTTVALSIMCDLPIGVIERALVQDEPEQLLVFAKAIDLSWETTKTLLVLQAGQDKSAKEKLNQHFASYFRLKLKTAQAALQFYRLRERANQNSLH